jgi:hypothetical protein
VSGSRQDDEAPLDPNEPPRPPDMAAEERGLGEPAYPPPQYQQYGPAQSGPAGYPPYLSAGYPQQPWSPGQPPGGYEAPNTGRRTRLIIAVAAILLVGAALGSYFIFFSRGPGSSSPKAAAEAWLDAVNAGDLKKARQLTCAQDLPKIVSIERRPGSYRITGTKLTDSRHAEVHVVFDIAPDPLPREVNLPVAKKDGWQVCF